MTKRIIPVTQRLVGHCARLSEDIKRDYEDTIQSGTPEAVASYRETFIQEVVGRFFPRTYAIAKGAIYDSYDHRSNSIDCVVCAANHPLLLDSIGRITTLLAEGVQCAIEIKPDLTDLPPDFGASRQSKPEIVRALEQLRSVKRLQRREFSKFGKKSAEILDYSMRIPAYLFSVESIDIKRLCEYTSHYYVSNNVPLSEQLDMIVVLHSGLVLNTKFPEVGITFSTATPKVWQSGAVAFACGNDALCYFLVRATSDVGPEMTMSKPVLFNYFPSENWPKSWRTPVAGYPNTR